MADLSEYRRKRRAGRTPEPLPPGDDLPHGDDDTFVIQEHHASQLHWDVRLERDGVLVSWAVPKGLPAEPGKQRLAVHTEDHPLEYAEFEGEIPKGEYGAGRMTIWDRGRYETLHWNDHKVEVVLHGGRVSGCYAFINQHEQGRERNWMVLRVDPPVAGHEELPEFLPPMRARAGDLPDGDGWAFEFKWAGLRVQARVEGGRVALRDPAGEEVTKAFPELRGFGEQFGSTELLLDGELVVFAEGRPSPDALDQRLASADAARSRRDRLADRLPAVYLPFDLLHLDGKACLDLPYQRRRELLDGLDIAGPHWRVPEHYLGDGAAVLRAAVDNGLAGVVAKPTGSPYRPGEEGDWIAVTGGNI